MRKRERKKERERGRDREKRRGESQKVSDWKERERENLQSLLIINLTTTLVLYKLRIPYLDLISSHGSGWKHGQKNAAKNKDRTTEQDQALFQSTSTTPKRRWTHVISEANKISIDEIHQLFQLTTMGRCLLRSNKDILSQSWPSERLREMIRGKP